MGPFSGGQYRLRPPYNNAASNCCDGWSIVLSRKSTNQEELRRLIEVDDRQ